MEVSILSQKDFKNILGIIIAIILLPIIIPIILIVIFINFIITPIVSPFYERYLKNRVYSEWYTQSEYMLFVYSDSPVWKEYIETNILPRISESAIMLVYN